MGERSLYERLGGIYAIAAVVDRFSDQLLKNPKIVNANPQLKEWHTQKCKTRLPGLKFGRTLWVASVAGGPYQYTGKPLSDAHFDLRIPPEVFDEVSAELGRTLDHPRWRRMGSHHLRAPPRCRAGEARVQSRTAPGPGFHHWRRHAEAR